MNWIIEETNYTYDFNTAQRLMYILEEKSIPFVTFKYFPFEGTDYSFLPSSPAVFYGTYNALMDMIKRVPKLPTPLAWCDLKVFSCSTYYKKLKPYIFQQEHKFLKLKDISKIQNKADKLFFRPDDNEKSFTGQVVEREFWATFPQHLIDYKYLAGNIVVVASPVKTIDAEWRLLIVNKEVVTASQYKLDNALDIQPGCPVECMEYARKVSSHWSPHPVYIMDICSSEGKYWVMEIGPFNYAGLYKCDLEKVVDSIDKIH